MRLPGTRRPHARERRRRAGAGPATPPCCWGSRVAITQPVLDLFGRNPALFVAGHYTTSQIILFALTALVPAAVVFVATTVPGLVVQRIAGAPRRRRRRVRRPVRPAAVPDPQARRRLRRPGRAGARRAVAVAEWRAWLAWQFLAYLAIGNLAFVVLFLTASPTAELIGSSASRPAGRGRGAPAGRPGRPRGVRRVPVTSIMRSDGTINDTRYPNLARLAGGSTWFRNAASESRTTYVSTPSIRPVCGPTTATCRCSRSTPATCSLLFATAIPSTATSW